MHAIKCTFFSLPFYFLQFRIFAPTANWKLFMRRPLFDNIFLTFFSFFDDENFTASFCTLKPCRYQHWKLCLRILLFVNERNERAGPKRVSYKFPLSLAILRLRAQKKLTWKKGKALTGRWKMIVSLRAPSPFLDFDEHKKNDGSGLGFLEDSRSQVVRIDIFINSKNHLYLRTVFEWSISTATENEISDRRGKSLLARRCNFIKISR